MSRRHLYHFSEDPDIRRFVPHVAPTSSTDKALVWTVDAAHAHLYYFPRDCPRVIYSATSSTSTRDMERFFGHTTARAIAAIESKWLEPMRSTTIYRYTLPSEGFELHDKSAGYWVSTEAVDPLTVEPITDLIMALVEQDVELRIMPSLRLLREMVIASTVDFGIIRWRNEDLTRA